MIPKYLDVGGVAVLGNKWGCPVCPKRYRKKAQAEIHILNNHEEKSFLKSLGVWFKWKKSLELLINIRQSKETERRYKQEDDDEE